MAIPIFIEKHSGQVYTFVKEGMELPPYKVQYKEIKIPQLLVYRNREGTEIQVAESHPFFRRER